MQPDIEIYVLSCPTDRITSWLNKRFSIVSTTTPSDLCTKVTLIHEEKHIPVTILEQAAGKRFTSIWFDSANTPWKDDITCAREAFEALTCEVRCNFQGWEEEGDQDPDQWWKISSHGEGPFIWK